MLTEKRHEAILEMLENKGSVTLQELKECFDTSESTIRRDLNALHEAGKLVKVFGGAVALENKVNTRDEQVSLREEQNRDEKIRIAKYAASLIGDEDFVYLDAGTTTGYMIDFIQAKTATYVTNAVSHALRLADAGFHVIVIGGELKASTQAIIGNEAYESLKKYNFTIGFFGTNGISRKSGFSTPDINEAMVKQCAMKRTRKRYVVSDYQKFLQTSAVTFGEFDEAVILTNQVPDEKMKICKNIIEVQE